MSVPRCRALTVLPITIPRYESIFLPSIVVEAAHPNSWYKILGRDDFVVGMTTFGESAPAKMLFEEFGFTAGNIVSKAKELLNK